MTTANRRPRRDPFDTTGLERPESEKAVLAAMLVAINTQPAKVAEAAAGLEPAMFADQLHRDIMHAIQVALQAERPGIAEVTAATRRLADAGPDYHAVTTAAITDLLGTFVGHDPIRSAQLAGQEVREAYARREAILAMQDAVQAVQTVGGPDDLAAVLERLDAIRAAHAPATRAAGLLAILDQWARNEKEQVVKTGFSVVDDRFGGGLPIGVTGIAAKPGQGKSALALQLTLGALLADPAATAIWFRGEMTNDKLASRMVAVWSAMRGARVPAATARDARRRSKSARQVAVDLAQTIGERLAIVDPPLTPATIEREIMRRKPTLAVVDYLQLCEVMGKADRRAEVDYMTRLLARLATTHNMAIVAVSAVAKGTHEGSGIGSVSKESNQLDYDVDAYLTLWGDDDRSADPREIRMKVEKGRDGGEGAVSLQFSGSGQYFTSSDVDGHAETFDEFANFAPGAPA
jgi:replicative DNA helicase